MSSTRGPLRVVVADETHGPLLVDLFDRIGHRCYCRFWHHEGDNNSWLNSFFHRAGDNQADMLEALSIASPEMQGVLAIEGATCLGWMKITSRIALRKLYSQRSVRALKLLDDPDEMVFAVACFLVDPSRRREGIARELLKAGIAWAKRNGATAIEAFPYLGPDAPSEQLFTGPPQIFYEAGFTEIARLGHYPVLRLTP